MEAGRQEKTVDRKKRVARLKKIIVLSIVIGIIVPWLVCAFLIAYVVHLERGEQAIFQQLNDLSGIIAGQNVQLEELRKELGQSVSREKSVNEELLERLGLLEASARERENEMEVAQAIPEKKESAHKVYLTFDDGPSIYTNEILDILKQYDVKATFFVLGKESEESKEAVRRIAAEGHSLGMHSYNHQYDEIYASKEAFAEDFQKIRDYLFQLTGEECHLYRFPGGSSNTVSNVDVHVFIEYLREQNTVYYDWNVSAGDAAKVSLSAEAILTNATKGLEKQSVSVILFHDAASRRSTVDALPSIIEKIQAMPDTEILPITADTELVQHVKSQD